MYTCIHKRQSVTAAAKEKQIINICFGVFSLQKTTSKKRKSEDDEIAIVSSIETFRMVHVLSTGHGRARNKMIWCAYEKINMYIQVEQKNINVRNNCNKIIRCESIRTYKVLTKTF